MKKTQLNALGAFEDLELFDKNGNVVYKFFTNSNDYWSKYTYDEKGNELTFENSKGDWWKSTYDEKGNKLTFEDADGYWWKYTYDEKGNQLTHENSKGGWSKRTYDEKGNELTYEDSDGIKKGFDIPEFTMEELVKKIGYNFKIKK
jgi:YD repeat-containing protein